CAAGLTRTCKVATSQPRSGDPDVATGGASSPRHAVSLRNPSKPAPLPPPARPGRGGGSADNVLGPHAQRKLPPPLSRRRAMQAPRFDGLRSLGFAAARAPPAATSRSPLRGCAIHRLGPERPDIVAARA